MELSRSVIKQFVNVTNDNASSKNTDNTVFGEIVEVNGGTFVKIDGSDTVTPVSTTANVKLGDRVVVTVKDHNATIIGNTTDPSASTTQLDAQTLRVDTLEANYATIGELYVEHAEIEELIAESATIKDLEAEKASIAYLEANYADIYELDAKYATIANLDAVNATINNLGATYATIVDLDAVKADIKSLNATYADIEFANIGQAAFEKIYSEYGLIENLVLQDGTLTGKLAAVTIDGDLINAGTLKADRLIVKGIDGLYYQLNAGVEGVTETELATEEYQNALHGSNIIAKTITADKLTVSDLVAFEATIGGLVIDDGAIYSGAKTSIDNTTSGFYLDKDGQMNVGDASNYIKYANNTLEISAEKLILSTSNKSIETVIDETVENIDIGGRNLLENSSFKYDHSGWTISSGTIEHVVKEDANGLSKECAHISHTELATTSYVRQNILSKLEPDTEYMFSANVLTENIVQGTTNFFLKLYTDGNYDKDGTSTWWGIGDIEIPVNAGDGTWTRIEGSLKTDATKLAAATSMRVFVYARDFTGDLYFSELKIEKGNKATDWTAAPEDAAKASDMVTAQTNIADLDSRTSVAESTIQQLADSISMLVQDSTGTSLMTQTSDGWVFSTESFETSINDIQSNLTTLCEDSESMESTIANLNSAIDDIGAIVGPYVRIGEFEDEPAIILGEEDSDFTLLITNTKIVFSDGSDTPPAYMTNHAMNIGTAIIDSELQIRNENISDSGTFVWKIRANGNLGLIYEG